MRHADLSPLWISTMTSFDSALLPIAGGCASILPNPALSAQVRAA